MKKSILFLGLCMLALNANAQTFGGKANTANKAKDTNVEMAKPKEEMGLIKPHPLLSMAIPEHFNFDDYLTNNIKTQNGEKLNCKEQNDVVVCVDKNQKPFTGIANGSDSKLKLTSQANYQNGMLNGLSRIMYDNNKVAFEAKYINGKREGVAVGYSRLGPKQSETHYKNGKKDGRHILYYLTGIKTVEMTFKNDKAEGTARSWHPNGKLQSQALFVNNLMEGNVTSYYPHGKIAYQEVYKNGKRNGVVKHYEENTGKMDIEAPYVDGKIHGALKIYDNGKIIFKTDYENDVANGEYIGYNDNGTISMSATVINGKLEGMAKVFDDYGKLKSIEYYKDGEAVDHP